MSIEEAVSRGRRRLARRHHGAARRGRPPPVAPLRLVPRPLPRAQVALPRRPPQGLDDGRARLVRARREEGRRRGDPRPEGRRHGLLPRRRRRDLREEGAGRHLPRQDHGRALARGGAPLPRERRQDERHDALRPRRERRGPRRPPRAGSASCRTRRRASSASSRSRSTPRRRSSPTSPPRDAASTDLRVIAVSRLMLDNVDHVKAYWIQIGEKLAPVALHFGADDLVGTVTEETITHAAGATTSSGLTRAEMERMIRGAGARAVRAGRVLRARRPRREGRASSGRTATTSRRRTHPGARHPCRRTPRRSTRRSLDLRKKKERKRQRGDAPCRSPLWNPPIPASARR